MTMSARPKGQKYRNLHAYRDTVWYERVVGKRRYRENTQEPALPRGLGGSRLGLGRLVFATYTS